MGAPHSFPRGLMQQTLSWPPAEAPSPSSNFWHRPLALPSLILAIRAPTIMLGIFAFFLQCLEPSSGTHRHAVGTSFAFFRSFSLLVMSLFGCVSVLFFVFFLVSRFFLLCALPCFCLASPDGRSDRPMGGRTVRRADGRSDVLGRRTVGSDGRTVGAEGRTVRHTDVQTVGRWVGPSDVRDGQTLGSTAVIPCLGLACHMNFKHPN